MNVKDESGKRYGPYVVVRRAETNYPISGTARWICQCVHCGAKKTYIGNLLRFNNYAHECKECSGR